MAVRGEGSGASRERGYRSLFWPVILIGVGVLWLLTQLGVFDAADWSSPLGLWPLWPAVLIVLGLDMIFGRRVPIVGAILGVLCVAALGAALLWGLPAGWRSAQQLRFPAVGLLNASDVRHDTYRAPLGDYEAAEIELHLGAFPSDVRSLDGGDELIVAELDHMRDVTLAVTGDGTARVVLDEESVNVGLRGWNIGLERFQWDIALTGAVPIEELLVDASSGAADLDLADLDLRELTLDASSGSISVRLPAGLEALDYIGSSGGVNVAFADETRCQVTVDMSSGALEMTVGDDADLDIVVTNGSSGAFRLIVAPGTALHVDVRDSSSGSVQVPNDLERVETGQDDIGLWQSKDWEREGRGVRLIVEDMSSGNVRVQYR